MYEQIKYKIKVAWYYIEVGYAKLLRLFNVRRSISPIPKGTPYCYVWDEERNKKEPINGYWIKPCKYYRSMKGSSAACTYVGFIGFDPCLGDQCKICGVNDGLDDDFLAEK